MKWPSEIAPADRIPFARSEVAPEAIEAVTRVLTSGWLTTGPEVMRFESAIAQYVDAAEAVAVSSCTAALELSLRALGLPPGAKVLTSAMTFCGAVNAIIHAGLEPVLADIDPDTLMPNVATTSRAVERAGGVDAMVVLHFAGFPAPVPDLAKAADLPLGRVVEDAAHALGTEVDDRPVGAISAATCFSFYATKNLPIGEGGIVTTNDELLAERIRRMRLHGMSKDSWKRYTPGSAWRYSVESVGLKANMTDVQAAIGCGQLPHLPRWQSRRKEIASQYTSLLAEVGGIGLPTWPDSGRHAWHLYVIQIHNEFGIDRDAFIGELSKRGIDCSVHFIPIHHQPFYQRVLKEAADPDHFPGVEKTFPRIVSLPFYAGLSTAQTRRVAAAISDLSAPARPVPSHGFRIEPVHSPRSDVRHREGGFRR